MITLTSYQKIKITSTSKPYTTTDITFENEEETEINISSGKYGVQIKVKDYVSLEDLKQAIAQFEKGDIKL